MLKSITNEWNSIGVMIEDLTILKLPGILRGLEYFPLGFQGGRSQKVEFTVFLEKPIRIKNTMFGHFIDDVTSMNINDHQGS